MATKKDKTILALAQEMFGDDWPSAVERLEQFYDAARAAAIEECAKTVCKWCADPAYNAAIFHHEEWRHYRKTDMYVEECRAVKLRSLSRKQEEPR